MSRLQDKQSEDEVKKEIHPDMIYNRDVLAPWFLNYWDPKCDGRRLHLREFIEPGTDPFRTIYLRKDGVEVVWDVPSGASYQTQVAYIPYNSSSSDFKRCCTTALRAAGILVRKEPEKPTSMKDMMPDPYAELNARLSR